MRTSILKGAGAASLAAALWGTAGTAQSFVSSGGPDPFWVASLRLVFAGLFFAPCLIFSAGSLREAFLKKGSLMKMALAAAAMVVYNFAFFSGVRGAGIALASAVTLGSAPIWGGILNYALFGRAPSRLWCVGVLAAVCGGFVMAGSSLGRVSPFGLASCLMAGFCYASYAGLTQSLLKEGGTITITGSVFTAAAVIALPAAFALSGPPHLVPGDWAVCAYLGVFTTGAAYILFSAALQRIDAPSALAISLLEPVTAFFAARFAAGETSGPLALPGLVLILSGLLAIMKSQSAPKRGRAISPKLTSAAQKRNF